MTTKGLNMEAGVGNGLDVRPNKSDDRGQPTDLPWSLRRTDFDSRTIEEREESHQGDREKG